MMPRVSILLFAVLLAAPGVVGQDLVTVKLHDGRTLIGQVEAFDGNVATLDVSFPQPETITLHRQKVRPASWLHMAAAEAVPGDPDAQLELAALAEHLGLHGHAIARTRRALSLAPARKDALQQELTRLRRKVAAELLSRAEQALENDRPATAKLEAGEVVARYGDTPQADKARRIVERARERAGQQDKERSAEVAEIERRLDRVQKLDERIAERGVVTQPQPELLSGRQRRPARRAVKLYEAAYDWLKDVVPPAEAPRSLKERLSAARERIQGRLHDLYLTLGYDRLQRDSLSNASAYNAKACRLAPDSSGCQRLQHLIIQARLTSDFR